MKSVNIKSRVLIAIIVMAAIFTSCKNSTVSAKKEVEKKEAEKPDIIELSEAQMKAVDIELGTIEMKNLNSVVKSSGQLEVPPQNKASVNSLVPGIIKKILVLEGNYIHQGQTLAVLENTDIVRLQQDYLTLKKEFVYTQQEYQRQKELNTESAGTGKVFQQAASKYETDKARLAGMETQLQQLGINPASVAGGDFTKQIPILAPINGVIGHITVKTGSFVDMQTSLMDIVDNSKVHCDLQVYEKDLFKVKAGQKVEFVLTNQNNKQIAGIIYGINQSFENENKSIIVHAQINNTGSLKLLPGMYVSALINTGNQNVQAVPVDAVVSAEGKQYMFLLTSDEEKKAEDGNTEKVLPFKKIEVATGVSELGYIEITPLEEIPKNARIVTKGAFYILSKSGGGEEEH
ncbi:membrane fusion protein, cobalt-zinc-cadmium efflux system [Hydrobacter penzbergensis]|uniref:Membrane fusion protein, cobalt-zinc-cadmium efflux system n=1 Tax=Hydrobacter penzbergensis TaxID=1235997 RepID=A0A8X8IAM5_9BACT|nr:efflux RND transporter periplasmic adaptor subunit [Hydrobacter penzbergensis]SDW51292.1 membrane fusion protein, cobalt-zinc-cadmium efflux system [Hydrobacter penzbergensis]